MGLTRSEVGAISDTNLRVAIDGRRARLRRAWDAGQAGSLEMVYDLALLSAEAAIRGLDVCPHCSTVGPQLTLDDAA